jgi:cytochrome P450
LGGCDIPANALVTVVYGSANRDTAVFGADADQFLIDRVIPAGKNYVFGHGIHHCIGAPVVASIAPVVFDKLIKAMPNLRLAEEAPSRLPDPYFRALAGLELKR